MKRLLIIGLMLVLCLGLCACNSSDSSSSKKDKKSSIDSKDKDKKDKDSNDKKDSDDKSSALSNLFGGLTGDKDSDKSSDKDSKGSSSKKTGFSEYCHVATIEDGMLTWQVYEEDIINHVGVTCSFNYDEGTLQYNWNFIDANAYSTVDVGSPSGTVWITVYSAGGQDDLGSGYVDYSDDVIKLTWDNGAIDVFIAFEDGRELARAIEDVVSGYSNYSDGDSSYPEDGNSGDDDEGEPASRTDDSIDLSGLSGKQGIAYVYVLTSTGYKDYETGEWNYSDSDGYIHDGDMVMQRTLTVYREKNTSSIEYMLESAGEWGEYWHVEYDYPAKCTYFEYVEGGHVEISGNTAIWTDDYSGYSREIYTLSETRSYTN